MLEKEYDKEKELLEFALEETNDGWWDWLVKENKFYLSPRYWEAFGYDPKTKSHLPEEWQEICHPEDLEKVQEVLKKHFDSRGKVPYLTEVRFKHSQGHWITVICRGKTVEWDEDWNPIRFVGVHTDMTRYKEQEAKLVRANTELEQFAYRTSHDLKGPLLSIKGLTKFIEMDLEKGELDEVKENIRRISGLSGKLEKLVVDILDLAKADLEEQAYSLVSLDHLFESIKENYSSLLKEREVELILNFEKELKVFSQEARLMQIFGNLISNSIKYSDENKGQKFVKIDCKISVDKIYFTVDDNGVGIQTSNQNKLFDMFTRFNPLLASGSGLGMAIIKKNIDTLGGTISFNSNESGTRFEIMLPKGEKYV